MFTEIWMEGQVSFNEWIAEKLALQTKSGLIIYLHIYEILIILKIFQYLK